MNEERNGRGRVLTNQRSAPLVGSISFEGTPRHLELAYSHPPILVELRNHDLHTMASTVVINPRADVHGCLLLFVPLIEGQPF